MDMSGQAHAPADSPPKKEFQIPLSCPFHSPCFIHPGGGYKVWSSSLCIFYPHVFLCSSCPCDF